MKKSSAADTVALKLTLTAEVARKSPGVYTARCPALRLYAQGNSARAAAHHIAEASALFIESCIKQNTLSKVLAGCGFKPLHTAKRKGRRKTAPRASAKHARVFRFSVEIPVLQ